MAAQHNINPNQLKMFMSADEIMSSYQPLDADRIGNEGTERTTYSSGGGDYPTARTHGAALNTRRTTGGSKLYRGSGRPESDEEVWSRKGEEAWDYGLAQDIIDGDEELADAAIGALDHRRDGPEGQRSPIDDPGTGSTSRRASRTGVTWSDAAGARCRMLTVWHAIHLMAQPRRTYSV
jgi:hypothetical protein